MSAEENVDRIGDLGRREGIFDQHGGIENVSMANAETYWSRKLNIPVQAVQIMAEFDTPSGTYPAGTWVAEFTDPTTRELTRTAVREEDFDTKLRPLDPATDNI